jgi:SAM-dependent methyltransferase
MRDVTCGTGRAAAIYNSAIAAWAISAAWEVGALDELNRRKELDAAEFAARHRLDTASTVGMFRALAAVGVVERDNTTVRVSADFGEIYRTRSFFHWLSRGCAELFRQMPAHLASDNRVGDYYQRDAAAIAFACREMNELCYDQAFWAAVGSLEFDFGTVADLGCGSGARVMEMLRRYPGTRGIGIDIAREPLEVARKEAASAGLSDRAAFLEGNVLDLSPRHEFASVGLLTCFMMGHDFWPRGRCITTLRQLRDRFPAARRLLLGDTARTVGFADPELPVFTLGFELGHDLMGVTLPTLQEWESVFGEGGWRLIRTSPAQMVADAVVFELERADVPGDGSG